MAADQKNQPARKAALVLFAQTANPIALGEVGFYYDGSNLLQVAANGTSAAVGGLPNFVGNDGKFLSLVAGVPTWSTVTEPSLGSWVFSGNNVDLSGAGAMVLGGTTATSGRLGSIGNTGTLRWNATQALMYSVSQNAVLAVMDDAFRFEGVPAWFEGEIDQFVNATVLNIGTTRASGVQVGKSGGTLGHYGHTPTALQTGVAVTAAGIHAALVNLGLITA